MVALVTKTCTGCGEEKVLAEFYKRSDKRNKRESTCILCTLARSAAWYANNRDHKRRVSRANYLRRKYGITAQDLDRLLLDQTGCCAICDQHLYHLRIDHCHTTNLVRGLLCPACNRTLCAIDTDGLLARLTGYAADPPAYPLLYGGE